MVSRLELGLVVGVGVDADADADAGVNVILGFSRVLTELHLL